MWYISILGPGWAIFFAVTGIAMFFYGLRAHRQGLVVEKAEYLDRWNRNSGETREAWGRVFVADICAYLGPVVALTPLLFQAGVNWLR
jgi:hypothetical protein